MPFGVLPKPEEKSLPYQCESVYNGKGVTLSGEFETNKKISSVKTLFATQATRSYNFEIYLSVDGVNFKKVFAGTSSDSTSGDIFKLDKPTEAKFFKFIGQGGSNTDWILLHELEFIE